jgi:hypothetical protein
MSFKIRGLSGRQRIRLYLGDIARVILGRDTAPVVYFKEVLASSEEALRGKIESIEALRAKIESMEAVRLVERRELELSRHRAADMLQFIGNLANSVNRLSVRRKESQGAGGPLILVAVTAPSQFIHLKALCTAPEIAARYRIGVVSLGIIKGSDLERFCSDHNIPLFQYDYNCLIGKEPYSRYETCEDSVIDFNENFKTESGAEADGIKYIGDVLAEVREQSLSSKRFLRVIDLLEPSHFVLFEDNAETSTGIWVNAARSKAIPTVIIPFTIADRLEPAEAHFNNERYWADSGLFNRLLKERCPQWIYNHKARDLTRRPGLPALVAEALGFAQPDPWVLNSSKADIVAAESDAMYLHYRSMGIPASKLELTGSLADDLLRECMDKRDELRAGLGLPADKPVLLCALPPNQLSAGRPDCEFDDFSSLLEFWLRELAALSGWSVLIKVHPAMGQDDRAFVKSFGLQVSDLDTTALIPLCTMYNASVSSTIRWALACGKPVLNFDVFRYRYREFAGVPGVITIEDKNEFQNKLRLLTQDSETLNQLSLAAQSVAPKWGNLDGASARRMVSLFDRLLEEPKPT